MAILLVTYDHTELSLNFMPLAGFVKNYKHVQVSENSYAIETSEKTRTVFNKILPYLNNGARLFIVTIMRPFAVHGLQHVRDWLSKRLPEERSLTPMYRPSKQHSPYVD